ncbi:MAG: ribosome hibernation promotion factor, partial [Sciscionella sp.]
GPVVRAEACSSEFYGALDCAVSKIESRLRREHDRRKVHHGRRAPSPVSAATSGDLPRAVPELARIDGNASGELVTAVLDAPTDEFDADSATTANEIPAPRWEDGVAEYRPGTVVREKEHSAEPMAVDQALYEMELVGHDFYLFTDSACGRPAVVYRRRGFDYGVIRLA